MPSDAVVQLPPDSTGKKISTIKVTTPSPVDSAGAAVADVDAYQQVISLADRRGDVDLSTQLGLVIGELQAMRELLEAISLKLE